MKNKLILWAILLAGVTSVNADSWWKSKELQVEAFAVPNTDNFTEFDGGYGVGLSYFWHRNFGLNARIAHVGYDTKGVLAEDFSGAIVARLPIDKANAAPYLRLGSGYDTGLDNSYIDSGLGIEWRWTRNLAVFGEAQMRVNFSGDSRYLFPVGIRFAW